jgi:hypothetical protein
VINLGLPTKVLSLLPQDINISPNSNGLPGIGQLRTIVGASMTVGLILAVLALIISAIVWALGANSSNPHLAGRGKFGVLVGLGGRGGSGQHVIAAGVLNERNGCLYAVGLPAALTTGRTGAFLCGGDRDRPRVVEQRRLHPEEHHGEECR